MQCKLSFLRWSYWHASRGKARAKIAGVYRLMSVSIQTDEYEAHVLKCNANNRIKTCSGELDGSIKAPSAALHIFSNRHLYLCICTRLFKVLEWSISLQNLRESLLLKKKYSASTKALLYGQCRVRLQTILALAQGFSQCRSDLPVHSAGSFPRFCCQTSYGTV